MNTLTKVVFIGDFYPFNEVFFHDHYINLRGNFFIKTLGKSLRKPFDHPSYHIQTRELA